MVQVHPSFPYHLNTDSICLPPQPLYLTCARRIFPGGTKPFESNEKRLSFRSPLSPFVGIHGGAVRVMAARETKRNHPPSKIGPQTIESLRAHTYRTDRQTEQTSEKRERERNYPYCANVDRVEMPKLASSCVVNVLIVGLSYGARTVLSNKRGIWCKIA